MGPRKERHEVRIRVHATSLEEARLQAIGKMAKAVPDAFDFLDSKLNLFRLDNITAEQMRDGTPSDTIEYHKFDSKENIVVRKEWKL